MLNNHYTLQVMNPHISQWSHHTTDVQTKLTRLANQTAFSSTADATTH